jgi:hypothetical protein
MNCNDRIILFKRINCNDRRIILFKRMNCKLQSAMTEALFAMTEGLFCSKNELQ